MDRSSGFVGRLLRRLVIIGLPAIVALTLLAPTPAHASQFDGFDNGFEDGFGFCQPGFFQPVFVIPAAFGNVVILQDDCGFQRREFRPFQRFSRFDDFDGFNGFDTGGDSTAFNNSPVFVNF